MLGGQAYSQHYSQAGAAAAAAVAASGQGGGGSGGGGGNMADVLLSLKHAVVHPGEQHDEWCRQ